MKLACIILLTVALVGTFFFGFAHVLSASEREHQERELEWRSFSMQHHCVVRVRPTFLDGTTTWACEEGFLEGGFQITRGSE